MPADDPSLIHDPSLATLGKLFRLNTWENGEDYAERGRVKSLTLTPDPNAQPGWTIDATVLGRELYSVWLDLGRDEDGHWHFSSGCDCPVGERCKHQAAVLNELATKHPHVVPFFPENKPSKPLVPAWAAILGPQAPGSEDATPASQEAPAAPTSGPAAHPGLFPSVASRSADAAAPQRRVGVFPSLPPAPPRRTPPPRNAALRRELAETPLAPSPLDISALTWLGELNRVNQSLSQKPADAPEDDLIFFELGTAPLHATHGVRLTLMPARAKRLKSGEVGKLLGHNQSLRHTLNHRPDPELRALLDSLEAMTHFGERHWDAPTWGVLTSTLAEPTLRRALESGRVVSRLPDNSPSEPWHWGEPRVLGWQWVSGELPAADMTRDTGPELGWSLEPVVLLPGQTSPDEPERAPSPLPAPGLALQLEERSTPVPEAPPAATPRRTARPCISSVSFYRDDAQRCVGPLLLDGRAWQQALQWSRAPLLREGWLQQRRDSLRTLFPSLPASVAEPVKRRIVGVAPTPVLRLSWVSGGGLEREGLHYPVAIQLVFEYTDVRGHWERDEPAQQFVQRLEGLVELVRQPEAEDRLRHSLSAFAVPRAQVERGQHSASNQWLLGGPRRPNPITLLAGWLAQDFAPLKAQGFKVELEEHWDSRTQRVDELDADLAETGQNGWLELTLGFSLGGQRVNLLPLLPQILAGLKTTQEGQIDTDSLPERLWLHTQDGQWWNLPAAPLRPWLDTLLELLADRPRDFEADKLRLSPMDALRVGADAANFGADGHSVLRDILAPRQPDAPLRDLPEGLQATLRPYQHQGYAWLRALAQHHLGGVLADDMGLGKTLQTIAHLLDEVRSGAAQGRPSLVVAPTSLMGNWRRECQRFAPELRLMVLHGSHRAPMHAHIGKQDVVITTYPLMQRDIEVLGKHRWHALVLDEAQMLKNAHTLTAQAARKLEASHRLALTGTPMENHLGELWSLFDLVLPGYLGREARFASLFRNPIEKQGDSRRLALLRRRLTPFMLRRDKRMVATELPPKIEQVVRVQLDEAQANLYETIRAAAESTVREALAEKGLARSQITVLDALLKLRQACCDPRLVKLAQTRQLHDSAKLDWLMDNLPQMLEEGRRVLLFSQFTSMLSLISQALDKAHITWTTLTGQTRDREAAIARFTSGEVPVFLISLKAGGTGLNLPQADTVIHYDPWWNPAAEAQATDRAHRMGQTQTVFVYKLVAEGTLEERIVAMQAHKAELARGVQEDAGSEDRRITLSEQDVDWLLQPLGAAAAADDEAVARGEDSVIALPPPEALPLLARPTGLLDISDAVELQTEEPA